MVFSSTLFLFLFLPVTLLGYYVLKNELKNYWLLLASLIFFAWSQPNYLWIILLNVLINYCCAMVISDCRKLRKVVLFAAVVLNLALLFYFKYFDFVIDSVNKLVGTGFELKNIILPIGISFFTFQGMSYVIDVYKERVPVQKNIFKLALYITLFPQLIAGPIVRYTDVVQEIDRRKTSIDDFTTGLERFIIGLAKKSLIANTMAALVDTVWNQGAANQFWYVAWIVSIAYTLQIYFDFSGYSDMAIGLGRMFGFHFNENFNLPYTANSISDFWRRWHISLSSWFRDYVYIPLGGNRKHVYLNLAIVFLLTGIWHGASWHFIVWGIWNGVFILAERLLKVNKSNSDGTPKSRIKEVLKKIYTLLIVNFGWVLFRAPHTSEAIQFVGNMFGVTKANWIGYDLFWYMDKWTVFMFICGIFLSSSIPTKLVGKLKGTINAKVFAVIKYAFLIVIFYFSIMRVVAGTYNPFIYFQF